MGHIRPNVVEFLRLRNFVGLHDYTRRQSEITPQEAFVNHSAIPHKACHG